MKQKTGFYLVVALLFMVAFPFSSCKNKEKEAENSLTEFLDAIQKNDFEKAKEKSSPETKDVLVIVEKEKEKVKDTKDEAIPVVYEIVERDVKEDKGTFKVKFVVDKKEVVEVIDVVLIDEVWFVVMPPTQITILRFVIFRNKYTIYFKEHNYKKTYKRTKKKSSKKRKHHH